MRSRRVLPALLGLMLLSAARPALAQTQLEMNETAAQHFQDVDRKLNQTYQETRAKLDPGGRNDLKRVERLWLKFRDAFEEYPYAWGGSIAPMAASELALTLTGDRIGVLQDDGEVFHGVPWRPAAAPLAFQDALASDATLRSLEHARTLALQKLVASARDVTREAPGVLKALESSDRAWLAYRDAEANFAASGAGNAEDRRRAFARMLERLTDTQAQRLDYYTHEGNM